MLNTFELRDGYPNATVIWTNSNPRVDFPQGGATYTNLPSLSQFKYFIIEWYQNRTDTSIIIDYVQNYYYNSTPTSNDTLIRLSFGYGIDEDGGTFVRNIQRVANSNTSLKITEGCLQNYKTARVSPMRYSCIPVRILGCNELKPTLVSNYVDTIYPVGAIYISTDSTSPASLFGGSWAKIDGKFLLGNTDSLGQSYHPELATLGYSYAGSTGWYWTDSAGNKYSISVTSSSYAATAGEVKHTLTTSEMPSHSHSYYDYYTLEPYSVGSNRHAVCYDQHTSTGTTTETTKSAGSGSAHNNMPPYLLVYMWKRTA